MKNFLGYHLHFNMGATGSEAEDENVPEDFYQIEVETIEGEKTTLNQYRGRVLLIVNIAGKCGFTPQLKQLEEIYKKYKDQGFVVLGFPTNDFLNQEPRKNDEIQQFCSLNYGVDFPLFAKIVCKGHHKHDLYKFLTSPKTNPDFNGSVTWNFNKFLISRTGKVINRFSSKKVPDDEEVTKAIEGAINSVN